MKQNYDDYAKIIKALSDASRLKIIDILSCGEKCACDLLEQFHFTQPTLSHHMKVLIDCGIVGSRKEGQWIYYFLKDDNCNNLISFLTNLTSDTDECICKEGSECQYKPKC